jgi:hypothetical protein
LFARSVASSCNAESFDGLHERIIVMVDRSTVCMNSNSGVRQSAELNGTTQLGLCLRDRFDRPRDFGGLS